MNPEAIQKDVELLIEARGDFRRLSAFPEGCRPETVEDGYAIQAAFAETFAAPVVGWKIACTSEDQQSMVGVDEPFTGRLFKPFVLDSPAEVDAGAFHMHGVESEFAFTMGADLPPRDAEYGRDEVSAAVATLHPAFELVDSRFEDWLGVGVAHIIADNAGNGGLVIGPGTADWQRFDLAEHLVTLYFDGGEVASGTGEAVLGSPLNALTWIANHLSGRGIGLRAGEIVTTGTVTSLHFAEPGTHAFADYGELGKVEVTFVV